MTDKEWFDSAQEKCTRTNWWGFVHGYLLDHEDRYVSSGSRVHYLLAKYGLWNEELAQRNR